MTRSTFPVTVHASYTAQEVPPRCRKPRPVSHEVTTRVPILAGTAEDFPVAFTVDHRYGKAPERVRWDPESNRLYRPYRDGTVHAGLAEFPADITATRTSTTPWPFRVCASEAEVVDTYHAAGHELLLVEGVLWQACPEPRYVLPTPAIGPEAVVMVHASFFNNRDDPARTWRADEFEQACTTGRDMAAQYNRGTFLLAEPAPITVHIPEAIALVTGFTEPPQVQQARAQYEAQCRAGGRWDTAEDEAAWFDTLGQLRAQLLDLGVSPVRGLVEPYEARPAPRSALV